jgi:RHS repeat-associated protein
VEYCWDRFGRLTRDGELTYQYDQNGNRTGIGYPSGVMATYGFDLADRQQSLSVQVGSEPAQTIVTGATYLPLGPLASIELGNGLTETRTYDGRYVPTGIQVADATPTTLFGWTYVTDGEGNITAVTDTLSPADSRTYGYQDVAYFLTQGDGPWGALSWSYDKIGNRLSETRDGATDTYSYLPNAAAGNTALLDQITLAVGGTRDYAYGPAGHLEQVTAGANEVLFGSDDEGRLSALTRPVAGASALFTYDGRSFLRQATAPPAEIFTDGYESGDLACWSQVAGGPGGGTCTTPPPATPQVVPTYSSEGLLYALETGGTFQEVFYLAGRPVAQRDSATGELLFLTTDHLGTPVLATDEAGVEAWSGGFEPFGEDYAGAEAAGVFLRFPGQWEDGVWGEASLGVGVYYNVHRWYSPRVGRYSKRDPLQRELAFRGGLLSVSGSTIEALQRISVNAFTYALSTPTALTDPLGLATCDGRWQLFHSWLLGDPPTPALRPLPPTNRRPKLPLAPRIPGAPGMNPARPPGARPFSIIPPGVCFCSWLCSPCEGPVIFDPRRLPVTRGLSLHSGRDITSGDTCLCDRPGPETGCPQEVFGCESQDPPLLPSALFRPFTPRAP